MSPAGAQINLQLTSSNYNGYHISCFGFSDGSIDLQVTGGTPPYLIVWSTNDTLEDLSGIPAGYYRVRVTDSDSIPLAAEAEITLTEPRQLEISAAIHTYPNKYNISVFEACNGMLTVTGDGGVTPYSWWWADSITQTVRNALCADQYRLTLTDNNGCQLHEEYILTQPERSDWQMTGNAGTDAGVNFIGTTDSVDLSFRTNNMERLRITGTGDTEISGKLKIDSISSDSIRWVYVDANGFLVSYGPTNPPIYAPAPDWSTKGNDNIGTDSYIGTKNPADLIFKTTSTFNGLNEHMRITSEGGIGMGTPIVPAGYKLLVEGKLGAREIRIVKLGDPWPDYVFGEDYQRPSLSEIEAYYKKHKRLPGMPGAEEIQKEGLPVGDLLRQQQEKVELLFLYVVDLNKTVEALKMENTMLKEQLHQLHGNRGFNR